ncbi:DUF2259 domain-containing protein [Chelativorans intermedius]|uniref:DUF2259 domain-containing protein n=1 Tax=Chelativorans intermedius TaxID=515947 RepID=A0ABV6D390_9HYPH|nr:DUF2259 domain-containing protein [Chelativorans intermedius]MCT8998392.1 DUF2259 domain-containing protein [Chelativorans intermedius]
MSILRLVAAAAAFALSLSTARAGDVAEVEILGFSADGGIFAFEEYGVQDGSGFAYANRFYIDTQSDSFLPGTPVRVMIEEELAPVEAAREEAKTQGETVISDAALKRGFTAGWNAVTELSADPHRMAVNPRPVMPPIDDVLEFRLEEIDLGQPAQCEGMGRAVGLRLLKIATTAGETTQTVHEDSQIPASRGCPLGYRLAGVQTFHPQGGPAVFAVLIAIRRVGFEGPDHRFIAVTGQF